MELKWFKLFILRIVFNVDCFRLDADADPMPNPLPLAELGTDGNPRIATCEVFFTSNELNYYLPRSYVTNTKHRNTLNNLPLLG